jgi:hypothetical protein
MKEEIEATATGIAPDTLGRVVANSECQIQMMLDASGLHSEHVFHWWITFQSLQ